MRKIMMILRTLLRTEIMIEDNDIIWGPKSVAKIMSGRGRTNAQLMLVNRAAALCGPRKPSLF